MVLAHIELGIWIVAGSTLLAAVVSAGGAIFAAWMGRETHRKLRTPGAGTGTIGQQVEDLKRE